jgi:hypothetical protein
MAKLLKSLNNIRNGLHDVAVHFDADEQHRLTYQTAAKSVDELIGIVVARQKPIAQVSERRTKLQHYLDKYKGKNAKGYVSCPSERNWWQSLATCLKGSRAHNPIRAETTQDLLSPTK